ncbi:protein ENHANCED DISEASE RESISTANCE 2 isoform X2 [Ziziphus jujuba]|uniref:Protein ENHANCED DISEASE RESISTANCE 2 isoform X2 n=1 Tax=Ziziphus jujuba TaxID=326968 RepID=A0A6P6FUX4_ZIZJJ|nr:protein ENHANCED DISEASE RESISTANCE 2 isoform X2 [Ziziphus jujuba]
MEAASLKKGGSERSEGSQNSGGGGGDERNIFEYFGWVYHLGVNSIGHDFCHLRFLFIRGKYVEMYKRDPHENPGIDPIRRGVIGPTFMVEELGRRRFNISDLYVLRFYNRLDETKRGEIACGTAGEARKWMEAFDQAKQQAEYELQRGGGTRTKLNMEAEINLDRHRPRVRRYAYGLKKLIRIGQGPESLLRHVTNVVANAQSDRYYERDVSDATEAHEWKCVQTINGVRIFEDVAESQIGKGVLVKAVSVVDASADTTFEVLLSLERHQRYEWDMLTGDLEMVDPCDGHYDVVYGTWQSKRDFVFSRQWFRGQDGTYTILQFPAIHKKKPPRSGYRRTKINPSTWEIRDLNTSMGSHTPRCVVTQTLEIHSAGWFRWKKNHCSKFEKSVPYALLCQVAGLKEFIAANPPLKFESAATVVHSKVSEVSVSNGEYEDAEVQDQFFDATDSSSEEEDSDENEVTDKKDARVKLKNVSWAISSLALKKTSAPDANKELDPHANPIVIDSSQFNGSLHKGKDETDVNCWTAPSGKGFMIRGKNYLKDHSKVTGGDSLLKLLAVDWLKADRCIDSIALHPKCIVQSEAGKRLPFMLVINLMVPAKPNYNLILYYAADRPLNPDSLLAKFVNGSDLYRDSRFKLIPSIVEGYWMVKRAVGSKACLLGKAVTCNYLRQDNFLEINVDIGSSSVARGVIGLVLGYVTSIVVDLAILIEAKEEAELPEYILGTVRLSRVKPDLAVQFKV